MDYHLHIPFGNISGLWEKKAELNILADSKSHRKVLDDYGEKFLDQMIAIASAGAIISYILYTISPETVERFKTDNLIYSSPFVLFSIYRYQYLIYKKKSGGDPTKDLLEDYQMVLGIAAWALTIILILLLKK